MPRTLPVATIRAQLTVPLRFVDGYATTARVFTFDGLVDGREHLAFGLGDRAGPLTPDTLVGPPPLVRPLPSPICITGRRWSFKPRSARGSVARKRFRRRSSACWERSGRRA